MHSFEVIVAELADVREKLAVDLQKARGLVKRRTDEKVRRGRVDGLRWWRRERESS